nr:histidine kinase [uncultured Acetatifactor sp.]
MKLHMRELFLKRKMSLAWQISLGTAAILLVVMVLGLHYIWRHTMSILSERDKDAAFIQLQNAQEQISLIYDSLCSNVNLLLYDQDVLAIASEHSTHMDYEYFSHVSNIHTLMTGMARSNRYIDSVFLYINDNAFISTIITNSITSDTRETVPIMQSDFYKEICSSVYQILFTAGHEINEFHGYLNPSAENLPLITVGCAAGSSYRNRRKRVVIINLNTQMLDSLLRSCFGEDSFAFLLDRDLSLLYTTDALDEAGPDLSPLAEGNNAMGQFSASLHGTTGQAVYMRCKDSGLTIVKYISDSENRQDAAALEIVFVLAFVLCGVIALAFMRYWIYRCLKPLDALCQKMGELESGRLGVQIESPLRNELGNVIRHFNLMSQALARMDEENRKAEKALHVQEILALRAQINPHFIFNVLNTFKWMALSYHANDLEECIAALAEILLPVFRENIGPIPLGKEIHYLKKYLLILSHQFGSQVCLDISLAPELESVPIPPLTLQPIVENCVRHGYIPDGPVLTVCVTARTEGDALTISVTDDGGGMDAETLRQVQSSLEPRENTGTDSRHIGLSNVNRRLTLNYGPRYGLRIQSAPGEGTTVDIRLPAPPFPPGPTTA